MDIRSVTRPRSPLELPIAKWTREQGRFIQKTTKAARLRIPLGIFLMKGDEMEDHNTLIIRNVSLDYRLVLRHSALDRLSAAT